MSGAQVYRFETFVGCDVVCLAYVTGDDGEPILRADLSSITLYVTRQRTTTPTVNGTSLTIANVLSDTLVTDDPRWSEEALETTVGRNFAHVVAGSAFPVADSYRIEYTFTATSGVKSKLIFEGPARSSRG